MARKIKFIDLFAGIGGFHLALEKLGGHCVFASEIDKHARSTYIENFKKKSPHLFKNENKLFNSDILDQNIDDIPDFDLLCAGFPCQPFSQAGHKRGFGENLEARGNMFFVIRDIIKKKKPKAIFLENVKHLKNHDKGRTFRIIKETIEDELNYSFNYSIIKASDYGLPQHRPRVYMVGFKNEKTDMSNFMFPKPMKLKKNMSDIFGGLCEREIGFTLRVGGGRSPISDRRNWDGYIVNGELRRITPKEGKKMMGLPNNFKFPVSNSQALKQLGNSVAINPVYETCKNIIKYINNPKEFKKKKQLNMNFS